MNARARTTRLTRSQRNALDLMVRAYCAEPRTDDGVTTSEATFYDSEVKVAYVNWKTAEALLRRGLVTAELNDPETGWSLTLTEAGHA